MSYILDALKKAEAERHHGPLAHPYAQAPLFIAPQPSPPSWWRSPWTWTGLAAAAALSMLAWLKPWQAAPSAPTVQQQSPRQMPQQSPQLAEAPAPPPPAPAAPAADAPLPQKAPPAPAKQKAKPAAKKNPAKTAPPPEPRSAKEAQPVAPAAESRVATLHELPTHIRHEIPALSVNGYLYSSNKADRTVLINKRLLHEGDEVAPGLTLEQLTPNGMVFNYKGYRYRTSY